MKHVWVPVSLGGGLGVAEEYSETCRNWHQVEVTTTLKDLDLALISSTFTHIRTRIGRLNRSGKETGLKISTKKTKLTWINARNIDDAAINGQEIEDVDGFEYLGAKLTKYGGTDNNIKSRLGNAVAAFNTVAKIWRSGQLSKDAKIRIFKSNVIAVLL